MFMIKCRFVYHSGTSEPPYIYGEWVPIRIALQEELPMRPNKSHGVSHIEFIRTDENGEAQKGYNFAET